MDIRSNLLATAFVLACLAFSSPGLAQSKADFKK
jgi:hypothetical protein